MAIIKWDPFKDLMNLQEKMNQIFENNMVVRPENFLTGSWIPAVDVYETREKIFVKAELPGVDCDGIAVEVRENVLTIKGERKIDEVVQQEKFHRIERHYGKFRRSFALPTDVDEEGVKAQYRDGVLEIELPKLPAEEPKKIEVKVS